MDNQETKVDPKEILNMIATLAIETPMEKVRRLVLESRRAKIGRAMQKFSEDHVQIGEVQTGRFRRDKEGKAHNITVPVYKFIGWNRNKKYTGEALRELERRRTLEALKADPSLNESRLVNSDAWQQQMKDSAPLFAQQEQARRDKKALKKAA